MVSLYDIKTRNTAGEGKLAIAVNYSLGTVQAVEKNKIIQTPFIRSNIPGFLISVGIIPTCEDKAEPYFVIQIEAKFQSNIIDFEAVIFLNRECINKWMTFNQDFLRQKIKVIPTNFLLDNAKNYFPFDDSTTMTIDLCGQIKSYSNPPGPIVSPSTLANKLYHNEASKDIALRVNGTEIKAHKNVLEEYSDVLKAHIQQCGNIINIDEYASPQAVQMAINCCYDQPIQNFGHEVAMDCLKFCDAFNLEIQYETAQQQCINVIDHQNVVQVANFAFEHGFEILLDYCISLLMHILKNQHWIQGFNDTLKTEIKLEVINRQAVQMFKL